MCWAGLQPAVRAVLTRAGYRLNNSLGVVRPWPNRPVEPTGMVGPFDQPLLDFARLYDRALIRFGSSVNRERLIAQLVLAYPGWRFVIVAVGESKVRRIAARLKRLVPDVVWASWVSCPREVGRVVVATPSGLLQYPAENGLRDVVVVYDVLETASRKPRDLIQRAFKARLFGFLATDKEPSPRDAYWLNCLFGFKEVVIPRHGHVPRPVAVITLPIRGGPPLRAARSTRLATQRARGSGRTTSGTGESPGLPRRSPTWISTGATRSEKAWGRRLRRCYLAGCSFSSRTSSTHWR